jgi:hypothetical protein
MSVIFCLINLNHVGKILEVIKGTGVNMKTEIPVDFIRGQVVGQFVKTLRDKRARIPMGSLQL